MFKTQKKIDRKVDELMEQLYEVEGEITDYLEFYRSNFNKLMKVTMQEFPDLGSNIIRALGHYKCEETLDIDPDFLYTDFFIEITTTDHAKYYLKKSLRYVDFKRGHNVKAIVKSVEGEKYLNAFAIIDMGNGMLYTGLDCGRIASLATGFNAVITFIFLQTIGMAFIGIILFLIFLFSNDRAGFSTEFIWFVLSLNLFVMFFGVLLISIWWFFSPPEDFQKNIHAEAVFKKLGFNSVKKLDLNQYSLLAFNRKNKKEVDYWDEQKQACIFLLETALREHNRKYKK